MIGRSSSLLRGMLMLMMTIKQKTQMARLPSRTWLGSWVAAEAAAGRVAQGATTGSSPVVAAVTAAEWKVLMMVLANGSQRVRDAVAAAAAAMRGCGVHWGQPRQCSAADVEAVSAAAASAGRAALLLAPELASSAAQHLQQQQLLPPQPDWHSLELELQQGWHLCCSCVQ
ncbi:hypothetical protein COO60DRAFT_866348 [Scenedesmus sp. NREL 46B-D3]|nr:hypothetical protein COO60DRAFT_866348 [Scenedesmus sp. NREL 46B-D3]